jgi:hypothetical protein
MDAHPSEPVLKAFGLGRLESPAAEAVGRHVEACSACRDRVASLSADSFLGRVRNAHAAPAGETLGFTVARPSGPPPAADSLPPGLADHTDYRIDRELGRGGMGVVYLAHNTLLGRDEVLKVMGRQYIDRPGVFERFQREIRAVARLRHPNIVAAYSAFRIAGGLVFAMEYVEGLDLARIVKTKGALPVVHAAYFARQAALGLQHAHDRTLIHRDIKPHNLMLTHEGRDRVVKVLDFGLAKATREERVDHGLTHEGQALGTPDYIAPEQIVGAADVDIRADIYSLGATLYYLLAGRPPFREKSLYDTYQAHISRDAERLNLIRPEVPSELAALVAKMMAKDPSRRFQTPAEVAQALEPFYRKPSSQTIATYRPPLVPAVLQAATPPPARIEPAPAAVPVVAQPTAPAPAAGPAKPRLVPSTVPAAVGAGRGGRRRVKPAVMAAAAGALALTLGLGLVLFRTSEGVVRLEGLPENAVVTIDGEAATVSWDDGRKVAEIRAPAGSHGVEVKVDGIRAFGQAVRFDTGSTQPIVVSLDHSTPGFVPLFNGKNLDGWTFPFGFESDWRVVDGLLVGTISDDLSTITTKRDDFQDFMLRMEFRSTSDRNKHFMIRSRHSRENDIFAIFASGGRKFDGSLAPTGLFRVRAAGAPLTGTPSLTTSTQQVGVEEIVAPEAPILTPGVWHRIEIEARGNDYRMEVDGNVVSEVRDTRSRVERGGISFRSLNGASMEFRRIEIRELMRPPSTSTASAPPTFAPLFNGSDTEGWKDELPNGSQWNVEDGNLHGDATSADASRSNGMAMLRTLRDDFADFTLRAMVRRTDGPAREIRLYAPGKGEGGDPGPGLYHIAVAGTTSLDDGEELPVGTLRVMYPDDDTPVKTVSPAATDVVRVVGTPEWMTIEVRVSGPRITTIVDGREAATHEEPAPIGPVRIALMTPHTAHVEFRGIAIREDVIPDAKSGNTARIRHDFPATDILGSWSIEGDKLVQSSLGQHTTLAFGRPEWSEYDLRFQARSTRGSHGFKAMFHYQDSGTQYMFAFGNYYNRAHDLSYSLAGRWGRQSSGVYRIGNIEFDRWYNVRLEIRGASYRCFVDDELILETTDERFTSGRIGLSCWDSSAEFRDIRVLALDGTVLFEGIPALPAS